MPFGQHRSDRQCYRAYICADVDDDTVPRNELFDQLQHMRLESPEQEQGQIDALMQINVEDDPASRRFPALRNAGSQQKRGELARDRDLESDSPSAVQEPRAIVKDVQSRSVHGE